MRVPMKARSGQEKRKSNESKMKEHASFATPVGF